MWKSTQNSFYICSNFFLTNNDIINFRAIHECFYAYLWALKHAHLLGSTAEKVVVVGDSAGKAISASFFEYCDNKQSFKLQ